MVRLHDLSNNWVINKEAGPIQPTVPVQGLGTEEEVSGAFAACVWTKSGCWNAAGI